MIDIRMRIAVHAFVMVMRRDFVKYFYPLDIGTFESLNDPEGCVDNEVRRPMVSSKSMMYTCHTLHHHILATCSLNVRAQSRLGHNSYSAVRGSVSYK